MSTIYSIYGVAGYQESSEMLVGLECEIECIGDWNSRVRDRWNITEDGSLRNRGKEFISQPIPIGTALANFKVLHDNLIFLGNPEGPFSERTSIHVHVNCQPYEEAEIRNVVLMYALFEEYFFKMVHPSRRENIHCVPLVETFLPGYYNAGLRTLHERWTAHKYTALNIRPLSTLGTIEFRHMHGHDDVNLLGRWLRTINNLFTCATNTHNMINRFSLKKETIEMWFDEIFKDAPECKKIELPLLTKNQLLDVKLASI